MEEVYKFYSNKHNLMSFDQMFNCFKDFSLFPDLINLVQLRSIFHSLSEIYSNEICGKNLLIFN